MLTPNLTPDLNCKAHLPFGEIRGLKGVPLYFEEPIPVTTSIMSMKVAQFLTGNMLFPSPAPGGGPAQQPTQQPSSPSNLPPSSGPTSGPTSVPGGGPTQQPTTEPFAGEYV